jgi:hypothetical protein
MQRQQNDLRSKYKSSEMNKYLFLAFLTLASCSKSPEEKAKDLINDQMRKTLHDYKSYEPVQFGNLDSSFNTWEDLPEFIEADQKAKEFKKELLEFGENMELKVMSWGYPTYKRRLADVKDSAIKYAKLRARIIEQTGPVFNGWTMTHSFRAKNLSGNLQIAQYKYYFDDKLTKVTKVIDPSETKTDN